MCKCTPAIKSPWCGKPGCTTPPQEKASKDIAYIPVQMFVRIIRVGGELGERAMLVARRDDGREFVFCYNDVIGDLADLTVCDFIETSNPANADVQ